MSENFNSNCQEATQNSNRLQLENNNDSLFVVGIGTSAGGLKALEELFKNLPVNSGAAFVVVRHPLPSDKSTIEELLQRHTAMNIYQVTNGINLQPNSVYVMPLGKNLTVTGNLLRLEARKKDNNQKHELNFPIDVVFKSIAKSFSQRAIGVILSGSGSDGIQGIKAIEKAKGVVLVQAPDTAEFDEMPLKAIDTGVVDRILSPRELSKKIARCMATPHHLPKDNPSKDNCRDSDSFKAIIDLLIEEEDFALRSREAELHQLNRELERRVEERTVTLANFSNNLRQLHRLATTNYLVIEDLFEDYLKTGCHIFNLSTGIVSKVKNGIQEIIAARPFNLAVGHKVDSQNIYYSEVINQKKTIAYSDVEQIERMRRHPVERDSQQLECFIGTPIIVYGVLWGTLCFSATASRRHGFAFYEREIIELMAKDLAQSIATRRAQEALKAREARFRNTFEQTAAGIAHISLEGRFLRVNRTLSEIVGYPANRLIRMNIREITHAEDLADSVKFFRQILNGEIKTYLGEQRCIRQDGLLVWVHLTVSMVQTNSGQPDYFIAVIEDISDRKQAEAALKDSKEKLQRVNQAKDAFIAHVSHELRTPLNSILGFSQILQQSSNFTAEQLQNVDIIHRCGKHLLTLINDILDFSKIEANKLKLEATEFELANFLESSAIAIRLRAKDKGINFEYKPIFPLPNVVKADKTRLRQVLLNLLSNAVKFTQAGKVTFTVGYVANFKTKGDRFTKPQNFIRFQVEDTGVGIPKDKLTKIFLPFEQLNNNLEQEGTGLGLAISRNIVRLMNSQIYIESTLGKGSKFWFDLQLPEIANASKSLLTTSVSRSISKLQQSRKILVVDDNDDNCRLLTRYLQPLGFIVEEANNGKIGLAKALTFKPDAILLDLVMPVMDGREMSIKVRQQSELQNVKIFIVSANGKAMPNEQEINYQEFLSKPIDFERLIELLETHLQIEWATSNNTNIPGTTPIKLPSPEKLNRLLELAKLGDIEAVEREIEILAAPDKEYSAFTKKIKQLSASFQQHKLIEFIEQFL